MATVYSQADAEVRKMINKVVEKYFPDLVEAEATIGCLMADGGVELDDDGKEVDAPGVKVHGYPREASIKVNSLKDRVEGKCDVTITLDSRKWNDLSDVEKSALLHHALQHLQVKRDEAGVIKTDDISRPLFKPRPYDWYLGGYIATANAFEDAAPEVKAAVSFKDEFGQHIFEFAHRG